MRLNRIELEWFRGAADPVSLELEGKSVVVYGTNGSGKSSFVDAVEYILNAGKIGHLTHEYSGKKQEKGVINTHTPTLKPTHAKVELVNAAFVRADVKTNGAFTLTGDAVSILANWDYRRVVLRQDEVAAFISSAKGSKYSALLPLLGLAPLECAAENLRQLAKHVERTSQLAEKRGAVQAASEEVSQYFRKTADVSAALTAIRERYLPGTQASADPLAECKELNGSITQRVSALSADAQRHVALSGIGAITIDDSIVRVRGEAAAMADSAAPLIEDRLAILEHSLTLVEQSSGVDNILCPACGREIKTQDLQSHLATEWSGLAGLKVLITNYRAAVEGLSDGFARFKAALSDPQVRAWARSLGDHDHVRFVDYLDAIDAPALRRSCDEGQLLLLEENVVPVIISARDATKSPPPEADQLVTDSDTVRAAKSVIETTGLSVYIKTVESLLNCLASIEAAVRAEIRARSDTIINEISGDVRRMWSILHPNEAIDGVRLRHPDEVEKAIDIELSFYGVDLKSPRLTLSEGYRNSLGLCVFLSMARRDQDDTPVILDDVVVSLDRNHRGMIVELLEKEFPGRQVLVFTHDREWYTELRQRLDQKNWIFRALRPYTVPADGIAWSTKSSTFDDARAYLVAAPDVAGNTVRKIMDIELATRAERLQIPMPYRHGYKNDHRMAHDFLTELISAAGKAFEIRKEKTSEIKKETYVPAKDAIARLASADELLIAWGNRASHTFDIVRPEAEQLIVECERALAAFECSSCGKPVYKFDDGNGVQQCSCGELRWRYGKL
jgi:energy-coupling factor transporter ATP-binding protein EcfA2